jgi:plastocyanin
VEVVRRPTFLLAGCLLAVGLSACGDTEADEPEAADTGGAMAEGADCGDEGETITVEIPEFAFAPDPIEISACDSVVWENTHTQAHTSTGKGDQAWNTGNVAAGEASEAVRFEQAGSFAYICALHPFMTGTVEVA